jgi:hypothetical protein
VTTDEETTTIDEQKDTYSTGTEMGNLGKKRKKKTTLSGVLG